MGDRATQGEPILTRAREGNTIQNGLSTFLACNEPQSKLWDRRLHLLGGKELTRKEGKCLLMLAMVGPHEAGTPVRAPVWEGGPICLRNCTQRRYLSPGFPSDVVSKKTGVSEAKTSLL